MTHTPHEVQLALDEFDRSQLPEARRALSGDAYREAVREHFAEQFAGQGGGAEVVVTVDRIIIRWSDSTEAKTLTERGVDFLRAGDCEKGIGMLRVALQRNPADADALFNLIPPVAVLFAELLTSQALAQRPLEFVSVSMG